MTRFLHGATAFTPLQRSSCMSTTLFYNATTLFFNANALLQCYHAFFQCYHAFLPCRQRSSSMLQRSSSMSTTLLFPTDKLYEREYNTVNCPSTYIKPPPTYTFFFFFIPKPTSTIQLQLHLRHHLLHPYYSIHQSPRHTTKSSINPTSRTPPA
jgi:hypothetical protein